MANATQEAYLAGGGGFCPFCGTKGIEAQGHFDDDGAREGWQTILCLECGKQWDDIWELKGYVETPERT